MRFVHCSSFFTFLSKFENGVIPMRIVGYD
nr:MAG TPA: Poxvirus G7-like [Caudoviricetes sp.]